MLPSLNQNFMYRQCSMDSYVSAIKHKLQQAQYTTSLHWMVLLSETCYNFELRALTQQILLLTTTSTAAMSRKRRYFHGTAAEYTSLLGCNTHWQPVPSYAGPSNPCVRLLGRGLLGPADKGTSILPNVRNYSPNNRVSHPTEPEWAFS